MNAWGRGLAMRLLDPFFDGYEATIHEPADVQWVVGELLHGLTSLMQDGLLSTRRTKAYRNYHRALQIHQGERVLCDVFWDGNPGVHVQAKGVDAWMVAEVLRIAFPGHSLARADPAVDLRLGEGGFERMAAVVVAFAKDRGLSLNFQGDWATGKGGRTLYLGAPSSVVRWRIYEKGKKEGGDAPLDWVRVEAQVRPQSRAKVAAGGRSPVQMFQSCRWSAELFQKLGFVDDGEVWAATKKWQPTEILKARNHLVAQYWRILSDWIQEEGAVDFGAMLLLRCEEARERLGAKRKSSDPFPVPSFLEAIVDG